ncbi:MAG: phosphomannomutase, partial [Bdellovibrionales bacterium]|nr:phosphomannomutase [Bdellovibrionales bacterium]
MRPAATIFREYDIRGHFGVDFDVEFAFHLGRAYAELVRQTIKKDSLVVAVGHDCRPSSPDLEAELVRGITERGVSVERAGLGPTPQLYYTVVSRSLDGGIQVTASHNPGEDNGFKLMVGPQTLSGGDIQRLKALVEQSIEGDLAAVPRASAKEIDAKSAYLDELVSRSLPHVNRDRQLKVVVDAGNGMGGELGPELLRRLGCDVVELYTDLDGTFPNHHPDPTVLANIEELRERVVKERADVGIAWDGDADRIGVVNEKGDVVWGDMLLIVYGR